MGTTVIGVAVDCADAAALARFWAAVLGREVSADPNTDLAIIEATDPVSGPRLIFHRVPEAKSVKNRLHLDLGTADLEAEVERLLALGATRLNDLDKGALRWTTLADPEGNEFDVVLRGSG
jgi:predicted enzyme related to lactoylglutathione lyase